MDHRVAAGRRLRRAIALGFAACLVPIAASVARVGGVEAAVGDGAATTDGAGFAVHACTPRLLVLSAFPAELDKLLTTESRSPTQTVVVNGRNFYVGTLEGKDVVLAMTGIGPANARATTQAALDHFHCGTRPGIMGVVFSGVAGSTHNIGDVTVPARWTEDGKTWLHADPTMLATVRRVAASGAVHLAQDLPLGDPACICQPPDLVKTVHLPNAPTIIIGGDGLTTDPFGGRAVPCVPSGGDLVGCAPCTPTHSAPDAAGFVSGVTPLIDPNFFLQLVNQPSTSGTYDASDEETAAVAKIATTNRLPFIGFRAVSDGSGDPLMLPGFPVQFFVYKELAAENAATTTLAFLKALQVKRRVSVAAAGAVDASATDPLPGGDLRGVPNTAAALAPPAIALLAAVVALACALRLRRRAARIDERSPKPEP